MATAVVSAPASAGTRPASPEPRTARAGAPVRLVGLDRLRGVAVVCMLLHHVLEWTTGRARELLPGWPQFSATDTAAPAFAVAAGASAYLLVRARRSAGRSAASTAATVVRRYGILLPLGMVLGLVAFGDARVVGVLGALGLAVLLAVAVATAVRPPFVLAAAVTLLGVGGAVEQWANATRDGGPTRALLGGTFPLATYLGFVLVGWCAGRLLRHGDRPALAAGVGVALGLGSAAMALGGSVPDRYPGGLAFVVPGLAGTFLAYALLSATSRSLGAVDTVVRRAAQHTLGIFVTHYALFVALDRSGLAGRASTVGGVVAAVTVTVAFVLAAPRVARWRVATAGAVRAALRPPAVAR